MSAAAPLNQHWRDIYTRRWIVLATGVAAGVLAWLISAALTPFYESKATFYLATNAVQPSYVAAGSDAPPEPLFPTADEKSASLNVGILRGRDMFTALAEAAGGDIGDLQKRVDITVSGEFMVDVFARDPDPERAAMIANLVPENYAAFHARSMADRAEARAEALEAQLQALREEARALRAARDAATADFGAEPSDALVARLSAARGAADLAVESAGAELSAARARIAGLQAALDDEAASYTEGRTALTTPVLDQMVEQLMALRVDLAAVTDGPLSPRRTAIQQQMDEISASMEEERQRLATATTKLSGSVYEELRLDLAVSRAALAGSEAQEAAAKARAAAAAEDLAAALQARAAYEEQSARLDRVTGRIADAETGLGSARMQAANAAAPLVTVERAVPGSRPAFPIPVLNVIVAVLTGLILGAYYALFLGHSDRARVARLADDLEPPVFTAAEKARIKALVGAGR